MRDTILIVDDMEINRIILANGFEDSYKILEAESGRKAIDFLNSHTEISAVLLDLMMEDMDGIDVLKTMNTNGLINHVPVFIITSSDSEQQLMDAYNLGAVDVITKPFLMQFLKCRVQNIIELYRHRNMLEQIVNEQIQKLSSLNRSMIETLATLIEFRDCESGEHVKKICSLTEILLTAVCHMYPEYGIRECDIQKIADSAILHDVGKIAIPDSILQKPGRLTSEEFEIMKQHTTKGCEILEQIPNVMDDETYKYSYDICRHHHERWNGKGYPDGLKGDEISIWAQVVAVADVYDALTSPRVYKAAFTHEKAVQMINGGECGEFNPKILAAFKSSIDRIKAQAEENMQKA